MGGSTVSNFGGDGVVMDTSGDARGFVQLVANQVFGNGSVGTDDGVELTARGESFIHSRLLNNVVTGNTANGVRIDTFGFGTVNALLVDNNFAGNAVTDGVFTNDVDGTICMAMSSNAFLIDPAFVNFGAPANFVVALDGITNGFAFGDIGPGIVSAGLFGTTCEVLIDAEELAFIADGFPPQ
jgi:hypothetical protein